MYADRRKSTLTGLDILLIEQGAQTLPGNWYLDPVVDLTQPRRPRVWLRSADDNLPAISLERIDSIIWVSSLGGNQHGRSVVIGQPFASVPAAFAHLSAMLEAMETGDLPTERPSRSQNWPV